MSKDEDDIPQTAPLAPWGTAERGGQQPWPITPAEQQQHAAYWATKEAPAKARAAEIEVQIRAGGCGRSKDRGWGD